MGEAGVGARVSATSAYVWPRQALDPSLGARLIRLERSMSTRPRPIARLCSTAFLAASLGGCSLAFTSGPPPEAERGAAFSCTTSYAAPVLDLAWVAYVLAATNAEKRGGIGGGDIALSLPWVGSAAYGIVNVTRCEAAIDQANVYQGRLEAHPPTAPQRPLGPVYLAHPGAKPPGR